MPVDSEMLIPVIEPVEPTAFCADPKDPLVILKYCPYTVIAQAAWIIGIVLVTNEPICFRVIAVDSAATCATQRTPLRS